MKNKKKLIILAVITLFILFLFIGYFPREKKDIIDYLGAEKEEIVKWFGQPDAVVPHPGPGGEEYHYNKKGIIFIFAGDYGIVNNMYLTEGAEIFGVTIGKEFKEITNILGKPQQSGYDEFLSRIGKDPYYIVYYLDGEKNFFKGEIDNGEIELWFFSTAENGKITSGSILWKGFWRDKLTFNKE
jgi:hypothetical protein